MAMQTAFVHCRAGGVALFAPDYVRENFRSSTDHGGSDADLRGLRYLEWTWDPDPSDTTYVVDYASAARLKERPASTTGTSKGCSRAATGSDSSTASASRRAAYCSSIRKSSPGPTKSSWRRRPRTRREP